MKNISVTETPQQRQECLLLPGGPAPALPTLGSERLSSAGVTQVLCPLPFLSGGPFGTLGGPLMQAGPGDALLCPSLPAPTGVRQVGAGVTFDLTASLTGGSSGKRYLTST